MALRYLLIPVLASLVKLESLPSGSSTKFSVGERISDFGWTEMARIQVRSMCCPFDCQENLAAGTVLAGKPLRQKRV